MILDLNSLGIVWSLVLIGVILALVVAIVATRAGGRPRAGLMWDQMKRGAGTAPTQGPSDERRRAAGPSGPGPVAGGVTAPGADLPARPPSPTPGDPPPPAGG